MQLLSWRSHWDIEPKITLFLPVGVAGISSDRFLLYLRQSISLDVETKTRVIRSVYGQELTHQSLVTLITILHFELTRLDDLMNSSQLDDTARKKIERRQFRAWCDWYQVILETPDLPWEQEEND